MKITRNILITVVLAMMCSLSYAQTNQPDYMKPPKPNEKVLGIVSWNRVFTSHTLSEWYTILLKEAKEEYPNKIIDIRDMQTGGYSGVHSGGEHFLSPAYGKVVDLYDPETQTKENLSKAMNKAFSNVREGSRIAIDQVIVTNGIKRDEFKDHIIDALLDKGYKVVAKEHLDRLYEEQQAQQSGIYNDNTTVKDNNFSAVGYYVNVKITETSLRVQVINVSTGEYEGNATVNF